MTGALINALGIVAGGAFGLAAKKPIPPPYPLAMKVVLGVYTVWFGLKLVWVSFNGRFRQVMGELGLVLLALMLGKIAGRLLRLQKLSNSIGRRATQTLAAKESPNRFNDGFLMATALFCAGPLALLASVQEGMNGFSPIFIVKAGIDGLATYAFCQTFGWGVILSPLIDAVNATDGLLIFCVAMIILGLKKIEVADYFPSLAFAPLLTWWLWRG